MSEQKKLYRLGDVNLYIGLRIEDKKVKTTFTPFIYNKSKSKVKLLSSDAETTILDLPECQEFKKDAYSSTKHAFQKKYNNINIEDLVWDMNNILDYLHPYQNDVKRHEILENIVSLKELDKIINKLIKKFNRSEFVKNLKNRELAKEVSDKSKEF